MAGDKHPEWLPVDWKVEERKRCGRKRKSYIAPKDGLKFFTKPEVLRYINGDVNALQQQTEMEHDQVNTELTAQRLPAGWVKEIRARRGSRKKDTFYIEPVTGHEFRSMVSVLRYLETKDGDDDHICAEDNHYQSLLTEAEGCSLLNEGIGTSFDNKGDEEFAEGKTTELEPGPANDGAESSIQQNQLLDISVEDYLIESWIDFPFEYPEEEVQMEKSGKTPAAGSSSELPPGDYFNVPWFLPAYKLIIDEISVGTYVQQTSMNLGYSSVRLQEPWV